MAILTRSGLSIVLTSFLVVAAALGDPPAKRLDSPVKATIESTLTSRDDRIRQFAFDGDEATFFASKQNPSKSDHFTLVFDAPVAVKSVAVVTGRPDGSDRLEAGTLEVSPDGQRFHGLGKFAEGRSRVEPGGARLRAIRIKPSADSAHPLAIRELSIASVPPVTNFRYPIEFAVNTTDAPELKEWAEQTARTCERVYPMINDELKSAGFKPPHHVRMALKKSYRGVAGTSGDRITGSVAYFQRHRDDVGAMVHETVHVVQHYRGRGNPGWLVEGVSDYIRFFKFEPGKLGRINPDRARYNGSYRVTAAFLAYLTEKHDKEIVRKLNQAMREGHYKEEIFKELTGKTVQELGEEWRATLRR
jgi:hypothetical protein